MYRLRQWPPLPGVGVSIPYPSPQGTYTLRVPYPRLYRTLGHTLPPQKGPATRDTLLPGKDLVPRIPYRPVDRQTPLKTLPSSNFVGGR